VRNKHQPKPVLTAFVNNVSGDAFEAYVMGTEEIEGKPFYVLKLKEHPRIVKMAVSALKKSKKPLDAR